MSPQNGSTGQQGEVLKGKRGQDGGGSTRAKEGQAGGGQAADLMMRSEPLAARPADGMSQPALGKVPFSHTVTLGLHAAALRRTELK